MKISILLPFKENFSPSYAGAVSLFINDTLKFSKFRKNITVYGFTDYKKKFKNKYINIKTKKIIFQSQNRDYVNKFIEIEKKKSSNIIELHNRPIYLKYLVNELQNKIKSNSDIENRILPLLPEFAKESVKSFFKEFQGDENRKKIANVIAQYFNFGNTVGVVLLSSFS